METILDELCGVLEDELERQENVLAVCRAQGEAAKARDVEYMEAKAAALCVLIRETVNAEQKRLRLVRLVVDEYDLPEEEQTMSGLVATVPEPWKSRMGDTQARIQKILSEVRDVVQENNRVIRRCLNIVNGSLEELGQRVPGDSGNYDALGGERQSSSAGSALLDQRG
jgi:flagellar FlgN protein